MKKILLLSVLCLFVSCGPALPIALKGTYVDKPFEFKSEKSVDEIWVNIIDLFATKGLSVKLIDKSSGIIVSEKTSFLNNYTYEDTSGKLKKEDAYVVLALYDVMGTPTEIQPNRLTGEWNIRVKSDPNGKSIVNVNLTNLDAVYTYGGSQYQAASEKILPAKSTGKFEELIFSLIK